MKPQIAAFTLLTLSALVLVLAGMINRNEVNSAEFLPDDEPEAGRFI